MALWKSVGVYVLIIYGNFNCRSNHSYNRRVMISSSQSVSGRPVKGMARKIVYNLAQFKKQTKRRAKIKH